jgi:cytochrome c oxidase subunit 2
MPVQWMIGLAFVLMAGCLAAVFFGIALDARSEPWEGVYQRAGVIRRWWFRGLLAFGVVVFAISMTWLPYQFVRSAELSGNPVAVDVQGKQFGWSLSQDCLPSDQPLQFSVTSADVTHGFAIYDENGHIVGQTQAMPGYANVLLVSLPKPGTYTIHCTELCGIGHSFMMQEFKVGSCGSSGGCASSCA